MKVYTLWLFILLASSHFFHSQDIKPRDPQKKKLSSLSLKAGAFIDVNDAGYNESGFDITQLVRDVLLSPSVNNSCGTPNVFNVQISPNTAVADSTRAWGYFHRAATAFPFKDGIVLSTGYVKKAGNSAINNHLHDDIGSGSDPDLFTATNPQRGLINAVVLEFDFIPYSTQVKFNYLLASEEYVGDYPCSYSDAFALLIKPAAGGPYVNVAVLPGGAGPVSVTNIHPEITAVTISQGACSAINQQYFAGYNTANIETNFNGRTVPLTAIASVVPGQVYHFKMALADSGDTSYDTAVFLDGRSFDIGAQILDQFGNVLPPDLNICDQSSQVLQASVNDPNFAYQWYHNNAPIPNATTNTITATDPGTYTIEVTVPGNPCKGKATVQIHGGITPVAHDTTLLLCTTPDRTTFDLSTITSAISQTPGAIFRFYENQADAIAQNNNNIQNILDYNGNDGQILYVVVSNGFCYKTVQLTLQKEATPTARIKASKIKICPGESVTFTAEGGYSYLWNNFTGTGNIQTVTLYQTTTFTVYALGPKGCKSVNPATIRIEVVPAISSPLKDIEMCIGDKVTLDAGEGEGFKFLWSTGATTQKIETDQWGIYSVEIDNGVCKKVFQAKVMGAVIPFITALDYDGMKKTITVTAQNPVMNMISATLEYSIDQGISWQTSNIFTNLSDNTNYVVSVRRAGTHCMGSLDFFTLQINNVITPNSDGINDVLNLSSLVNFTDFTGSVYDRYGTEMFRFSKERPVWDGTISGRKLPTATYWYQFSFKYPKSKTKIKRSGWILLKNR
ncbi:choice-of-anchor L domain-containing protein [Chryseobacterium fluminis]|uniref:choice-of-anchor L domain-containing protein n=1 Tax=Chryseobacterium fluminis TaxID=2983606 RepID=UPI00225ABE51|nr:choice-of-anchor L domain-containing protein [Chryseobacterium sp. MMS21-Ot14]UZT97906.1 choice-of-anchor L domain-containing protein [Chryseobacterium sp. MMS21-Ot14]